MDWHALFVPSGNLGELVLRGTITYLLIVAVFRVFRRPAGGLSVSDVVVVVLVADAAQNGMADDYRSITEGAILVLTIVGWNFVLDWLGYRSRFVYRLLHPAPALLIRDGEIQQQNLRAELITRTELLEFLREQGVEKAADVQRCFLEPGGKISVIRRDGQDSGQRPHLTVT